MQQKVSAASVDYEPNNAERAMGEHVILEKGTPVRVQCANGRVAENVVWKDFGDVVLVCGKDQFERLSNGYPAPMPIGFKKAAVALVGAVN